MRPISPTWRMMVSAHCANVSGSEVISRAKRRFSRSAESWIGVSGFLISCAMRRATSAQAALRWADCNSVMSSKVTTKPSVRPPLQLGADAHQQRAPAVGRADLRSRAVRGAFRRARAPRAAAAANSGTTSASCCPIAGQQIDAQQFVGGAVGQLDPPLRVQPDHARRDAGQHGLGEAPALVDLAVGVHQLGALRGELAGHAVERARQPGHLVVGRRSPAPAPPGRRRAPARRRWISRPIGRAIWLAMHQPDQHRRRQHQQRHQREDPGEGDLQPGPVLVQPLVFRRPPARCAAMWSRICGSTGRPIISISGGVRIRAARSARARGCRRRRSAPPRRRLRACSVAQAGGGSTPRPANSPAEAITWPVTGS